MLCNSADDTRIHDEITKPIIVPLIRQSGRWQKQRPPRTPPIRPTTPQGCICIHVYTYIMEHISQNIHHEVYKCTYMYIYICLYSGIIP